MKKIRITEPIVEEKRKLKERGINIYFENENFNSIDDEADFAITLSGILAQEERRNLSENIQ